MYLTISSQALCYIALHYLNKHICPADKNRSFKISIVLHTCTVLTMQIQRLCQSL